MNKVSKIFNILSTISCVVALTLLYIFTIIVTGVYYNGYVFLMVLFMLLNPIVNLCRINKKIINNPIYHLIVILLSSYVSYVSIKALMIYNSYLIDSPDNSDAFNNGVNYFGDRFLYAAISLIIVLILSFIFKKVKIETNKDNSKFMLVIISITSLITFFSDIHTFEQIWTLTQLVFSIITLIKLNGINTSNELQKYYLILFVLGLLSCNPIATVLSIYMFM